MQSGKEKPLPVKRPLNPRVLPGREEEEGKRILSPGVTEAEDNRLQLQYSLSAGRIIGTSLWLFAAVSKRFNFNSCRTQDNPGALATLPATLAGSARTTELGGLGYLDGDIQKTQVADFFNLPDADLKLLLWAVADPAAELLDYGVPVVHSGADHEWEVESVLVGSVQLTKLGSLARSETG